MIGKDDRGKPAAKKSKVDDAKENLELSDDAAQRVKGGVQKVREASFNKVTQVDQT